MPTLRIEHPTKDFATWKAAFDSDPVGRVRSGVQRFAIYQPVDDPHYVLIDLEFATTGQAQALLTAMQAVWSSGAAGAAFGGTPRTRIINTIETVVVDLNKAIA